MKKLLLLLYSNPVVILAIATGTASVLAEQHIIPSWIPLVVLAVVTPIQRQLVTPESKLRKVSTVTRKELGI